MGFDLYFCWQKDERINFDAVSAWATGLGNFARDQNQLWYENPDTGVYFSLDFEPEPPQTPDDPPIPSGYFDTGLSFGLNFNRPSYFGHEAMPLVEQLAGRFGVCVVDPQVGADEPVLMCEVNAKELCESWLEHNRWAILTLIEDPKFANPSRMLLSSSLYLWRYLNARRSLQEVCGDDIFVPKLVPVRKQGTKVVDRAFTCTEGIPTVVPESEWVFVVRRKRALFRGKEDTEIGVISAKTFRGLLGGHLKPLEWSDGALQIIRPGSAETVAKILRFIERMLDRSEIEVVGYDSFVDVELSNGE